MYSLKGFIVLLHLKPKFLEKPTLSDSCQDRRPAPRLVSEPSS